MKKQQSRSGDSRASAPKRVPLAWLLWAILGIASIFLVSVETVASSNVTGSNPDAAVRAQAASKVPPGMVWIPEGTFLMGTDDVSGFPNERPAHRVHVEGFWIDNHDVTNAEFAKFSEATGYVTTAERKPDWEELKKELPPDTPKPDRPIQVSGA